MSALAKGLSGSLVGCLLALAHIAQAQISPPRRLPAQQLPVAVRLV